MSEELTALNRVVHRLKSDGDDILRIDFDETEINLIAEFAKIHKVKADQVEWISSTPGMLTEESFQHDKHGRFRKTVHLHADNFYIDIGFNEHGVDSKLYWARL